MLASDEIRLNLEQFDSHSFEIGDDFNSRALSAQGSRVATSAGIHAGNDGAEGRTKGIPRGGVIDICSHNNLELIHIRWDDTVGLSETNGICRGGR